LHSHFVWLRLSISFIANSLSCALAAHVWDSPRWTPVSVKLLLPPRQSRGVSPFVLDQNCLDAHTIRDYGKDSHDHIAERVCDVIQA